MSPHTFIQYILLIAFSLVSNSGFMMMFWVWMPTVPHRQKLGILTGICFHMGLNIMNGDSENGIEVDVDEGKM
jgi:hypothetical protein|eukprot:scaffold2589_cov273-Chaetoceros_neogracile.AAC.3